MAALVWDTVVTRYPLGEFETVPLDAQTDILTFVNTRLNVRNLDGEDGITTKLARIYLAAHLGVGAKPGAGLDGDESVAGPIASESTGDVSRSYVYIPSSVAEGIWSSTEYGRAYERLILTSPARLPFTV